MTKKHIKLTLAILVLLSTVAQAQTLSVKNGRFEDQTSLPRHISRETPDPEDNELLTSGTDWTKANGGSSDFFYRGAPAEVSIPDNYFTTKLSPYPPTDLGYAGIFIERKYKQPDNTIVEGREYIRGKIETPGSGLIAGKWYIVSFRVARAKFPSHDRGRPSYSLQQIGAYLSASPVGVLDSPGVLPVSPQIFSVKNRTPVIDLQSVNGSYLDDNEYGWQLITGRFKATGGEKFITIGNFQPKLDSEDVKVSSAPVPPDSGAIPNDIPVTLDYNKRFESWSYYFIDDVSIVKSEDQSCTCDDFEFNIEFLPADPVNKPKQCGYKISITKKNPNACDIAHFDYTINNVTYTAHKVTEVIQWVPNFYTKQSVDTSDIYNDHIKFALYNYYGSLICSPKFPIFCKCSCTDSVPRTPPAFKFIFSNLNKKNDSLCCFDLSVQNLTSSDFTNELIEDVSNIILDADTNGVIYANPNGDENYTAQVTTDTNHYVYSTWPGTSILFTRPENLIPRHSTVKVAEICYPSAGLKRKFNAYFGTAAFFDTTRQRAYCTEVLDTFIADCNSCCDNIHIDSIPFQNMELIGRGCCKKFRISNNDPVQCHIKEMKVFDGTTIERSVHNPAFPMEIIVCKDDNGLNPFNQTYTIEFYDSLGHKICQKLTPPYKCGSPQTGDGGQADNGPEHGRPGGHNNDESVSDKLKLDVLPNPVTGISLVTISVPANCTGSVQLCNAMGQEIKMLHVGALHTGKNIFKLDSRNLQNGAYFIKVSSGSGSAVKTIMIAH